MKAKITYEIECLPEDMSYVGNCSAIDEQTDRETENRIRDQLDRGNKWAWCCVKVTCTITYSGEAFKGVDYLGACSYSDEDDFKTSSGYYDDMKGAAYADALQTINNAIVRGNIAKQIQDETEAE
jgi:hypothetical protein